MDNLDKPWDWTELCKHPNITWETIKTNMINAFDCRYRRFNYITPPSATHT